MERESVLVLLALIVGIPGTYLANRLVSVRLLGAPFSRRRSAIFAILLWAYVAVLLVLVKILPGNFQTAIVVIWTITAAVGIVGLTQAELRKKRERGVVFRR
jgi:hypothetical protein